MDEDRPIRYKQLMKRQEARLKKSREEKMQEVEKALSGIKLQYDRGWITWAAYCGLVAGTLDWCFRNRGHVWGWTEDGHLMVDAHERGEEGKHQTRFVLSAPPSKPSRPDKIQTIEQISEL